MQSYGATVHTLHTLHTILSKGLTQQKLRKIWKHMKTIPKWRRIRFLVETGTTIDIKQQRVGAKFDFSATGRLAWLNGNKFPRKVGGWHTQKERFAHRWEGGEGCYKAENRHPCLGFIVWMVQLIISGGWLAYYASYALFLLNWSWWIWWIMSAVLQQGWTSIGDFHATVGRRMGWSPGTGHGARVLLENPEEWSEVIARRSDARHVNSGDSRRSMQAFDRSRNYSTVRSSHLMRHSKGNGKQIMFPKILWSTQVTATRAARCLAKNVKMSDFKDRGNDFCRYPHAA